MAMICRLAAASGTEKTNRPDRGAKLPGRAGAERTAAFDQAGQNSDLHNARWLPIAPSDYTVLLHYPKVGDLVVGDGRRRSLRL